MSEHTMAHTVRRAVRSLDPVRVENPCHPGTPDINYVEGWLELKWLRRWPENANESPVLLPHYTQKQRVWHMRRWAQGGNVFLLWQIGHEWMLFSGDRAALYVGRVTRIVLEKEALKHWRNGLIAKELTACLSNSRIVNASSLIAGEEERLKPKQRRG